MGRRPLRKSGPRNGCDAIGRSFASAAKRANPKLKAKQERRAAWERETAAKIISLQLPGQRYGVIFEDPERRDEVGRARPDSIAHPTTTMRPARPEIILARDEVANLAADDCALFLWSTIQHAAIAYEVLKTRGACLVAQQLPRPCPERQTPLCVGLFARWL